MKKYLYKHIKCYNTHDMWYADYSDGKKYFELHGIPCRTKKEAYNIGKEQVDFLNK